MKFIPLLLSLAVLAAGCIQIPEDGNASTTPGGTFDRVGATGGEMSARETVTEDAAPCADGIGLDGDAICATRTITVVGTISGISKMNVDLATFNGDVTVGPGQGDQWGFVATLKARGDTPEQARARLDDIAFRWAHEEGGRHFLLVEARKDGEADRLSADLEVSLPRSVALVLSAATSNGDVVAAQVRTEGLALTSSNGDVQVEADATSAALTTSNGDVIAALSPTASGALTLTTSNGRVQLTVPENARHGYDVEGTTSNGEVDILLQDGELGDCPQGSEYYTPPCNHRTFRTSGYSGRDVRTRVDLTSSNGDINAGPM